jgi:hypothetical protein
MKTTQFTTLNTRKLTLLSIFTLGACAMSVNSYAATALATSSAIIVQPISITQVNGLSFGSFLVGTSGGTFELGETGTIETTGDLKMLNRRAPMLAEFEVRGDLQMWFSITTEGSSTSLDDGSGNTMAITYNHETSDQAIGNTGIASFFVGGKLTVPGSQTYGDYSGTISASVEYD